MPNEIPTPHLTHVSLSAGHTFHKHNQPYIDLVAGFGIIGDAHAGATVKHRSRVQQGIQQNIALPNLRQVHLIHGELLDALCAAGFSVAAGVLGENITTRNIPLLDLPKGTRLHFGLSPESGVILEVTGLRNPCVQLDQYQAGLQKALLDRDEQGNLIRKCGIMCIVIQGGRIYPNDAIQVVYPPMPHEALSVV